MDAFKLLALVAAGVTAMPAAVIGYNLGWSGSAGYTLSGSFTFDDVNSGGGRVDASELLSFSVTGLLSGNPVGTYNLSSPFSGTPDEAVRIFVGSSSKGTAKFAANVPSACFVGTV